MLKEQKREEKLLMREFLLKTAFSSYGYNIVTNFKEFLYSPNFEFYKFCTKIEWATGKSASICQDFAR